VGRTEERGTAAGKVKEITVMKIK